MTRHIYFRGWAECSEEGNKKIWIDYKWLNGHWTGGSVVTGDDMLNGYHIVPKTLCQSTQFMEFENGITGRYIFEGDIVEGTTRSGSKYRYIIWYNEEVGRTVAAHWDIDDTNREFTGYPINYRYNTKEFDQWDDFAFMMQDPYGDMKSVKVIGNFFENPELVYIGDEINWNKKSGDF